MKHLRLTLVAVAPLVLVLVGCGWDPSPGSGVRTDGEIHLTRDQPVVAVEFEASFESHVEADGILAQLSEIHPSYPEEFTAIKTLQRQVWNDGAWVRDVGDPEITGLGLNTFRYRWIVELADDVSEATIPFEVEINPIWAGGGERSPPGRGVAGNLTVSVVSIYPVDES